LNDTNGFTNDDFTEIIERLPPLDSDGDGIPDIQEAMIDSDEE